MGYVYVNVTTVGYYDGNSGRGGDEGNSPLEIGDTKMQEPVALSARFMPEELNTTYRALITNVLQQQDISSLPIETSNIYHNIDTLVQTAPTTEQVVNLVGEDGDVRTLTLEQNVQDTAGPYIITRTRREGNQKVKYNELSMYLAPGEVSGR